jgi:DNA-binding response OmpR family regulator
MDSLGSVLLVDDEETFRESTCRLLRRNGFQCHCAGSGDEAVKALQDRRFDLMIADIRMPGNPDLRVVHAAKELDSQMPVVLVTGYPSTETAIRGIDLSVAAYMTKPLDFDKLLGHLKSAIEHSRKPRVLAAVRERLQTCLADLDAMQSGLIPGAAGNEVMVSVGTIRTLAACLSELLRLSPQSGVDSGSSNLCELLDCPQRTIHRQAIVDTIAVLKRTKEAFKSKELAELRTKLEQLFGPR